MGIANLAFASTAHTSAAAAIMMGTAAGGCCIITAIATISYRSFERISSSLIPCLTKNVKSVTAKLSRFILAKIIETILQKMIFFSPTASVIKATGKKFFLCHIFLQNTTGNQTGTLELKASTPDR